MQPEKIPEDAKQKLNATGTGESKINLYFNDTVEEDKSITYYLVNTR